MTPPKCTARLAADRHEDFHQVIDGHFEIVRQLQQAVVHIGLNIGVQSYREHAVLVCPSHSVSLPLARPEKRPPDDDGGRAA